jgi:hypothetical protein
MQGSDVKAAVLPWLALLAALILISVFWWLILTLFVD